MCGSHRRPILPADTPAAAPKPHAPLPPRTGKPGGAVATGSLRGTMRAVMAAKRWRSMVAPVPEEGPMVSESQTEQGDSDDDDDDADDTSKNADVKERCVVHTLPPCQPR